MDGRYGKRVSVDGPVPFYGVGGQQRPDATKEDAARSLSKATVPSTASSRRYSVQPGALGGLQPTGTRQLAAGFVRRSSLQTPQRGASLLDICEPTDECQEMERTPQYRMPVFYRRPPEQLYVTTATISLRQATKYQSSNCVKATLTVRSYS